MQELKGLCFVLIAGGLGERLGYSDIKIGLPVVTIEADCSYIKFYLEYAAACRKRALHLDPELDPLSLYVPFAIMVSQDTHAQTVKLLE